MFDIAFGLILYHFLTWFIPFLFVVFVVVPVVCNVANRDGYVTNVRYVMGGLKDLFRFLFGKN
jgi:hypothetical protein